MSPGRPRSACRTPRMSPGRHPRRGRAVIVADSAISCMAFPKGCDIASTRAVKTSQCQAGHIVLRNAVLCDAGTLHYTATLGITVKARWRLGRGAPRKATS
jgi:hypothetical protein